jgi:uncharacterized membrane protein
MRLVGPWDLVLTLIYVLAPVFGLIRARLRKRKGQHSGAAVNLAFAWLVLLLFIAARSCMVSDGPSLLTVPFLVLTALWLGASLDANRAAERATQK